MFIDIVFPKDNEKEFITTAFKLGTRGILFVYRNEKKLSDIKKFAEQNNVKAYFSVLGKKGDLIAKNSTPKNRTVIESKSADFIFDLEDHPGKSSMHHRSSNLNQVLCNLAREKKVQVAFSFNSIVNPKNTRNEIVMGRMMQNVRFCRKFHVGMIVASFAGVPEDMRAKSNLESFGVTLGMNQSESKKALMLLGKLLDAKHNKNFVNDYVEIIS